MMKTVIATIAFLTLSSAAMAESNYIQRITQPNQSQASQPTASSSDTANNQPNQ